MGHLDQNGHLDVKVRENELLPILALRQAFFDRDA